MKSFEIKQELFGLEAKYEVREDGGDEIIRTLRGTETIMRLLAGDEGDLLATFRMKSVLSDTRFEAYDAEDQVIARFEFPLIEFKKRFHLLIGDWQFEGQGGIRGKTFRFRDSRGDEVLVIAKLGTFRDRYKVQVGDAIPVDVALLAAAVVDQKYFEHRG